MVDFKVRRGPSSVLFSSPGIVNPRLVIEEGCWYLCTDTAELFLGAVDDSGRPVLKRINGNSDGTADLDPDIAGALAAIRQEITALENLELFKKIDSEADLPTDFTAEDFNPNITYYIPLEANKISTFIFDKVAQSYMCTNSVDELVIRAMVADEVESILGENINEKLPEAVKKVLGSTILHGGNATS